MDICCFVCIVCMMKNTVIVLYFNWYNERFVLIPIERIPKNYINNVLFTNVETKKKKQKKRKKNKNS